MTACISRCKQYLLRWHVLIFCLYLLMVLILCGNVVFGFLIYTNCKQVIECIRISNSGWIVLANSTLQFGLSFLVLYIIQNNAENSPRRKIVPALIHGLFTAWSSLINVLHWQNIYDFYKIWNDVVVLSLGLVGAYIALGVILLLVLIADSCHRTRRFDHSTTDIEYQSAESTEV